MKTHGFEMDVGDDPDAIVNREKRSIKGLLLEMKLSENSEMRINAEEEIVNQFDALKAENERLREQKEYGISKDLFDDVCCERDTAYLENEKLRAELMALKEPVECWICAIDEGHQYNARLHGRQEYDLIKPVREALTRIDNFLNGGGEK